VQQSQADLACVGGLFSTELAGTGVWLGGPSDGRLVKGAPRYDVAPRPSATNARDGGCSGEQLCDGSLEYLVPCPPGVVSRDEMVADGQ
jgi:hypothetical protein